MDSNQIHFRVEIAIEEGKAEEFTKLIQDMSRTVEANEPDTLEYKFYLNRNKTNCIAHETYRNSEASIAHNNGVASKTILPAHNINSNGIVTSDDYRINSKVVVIATNAPVYVDQTSKIYDKQNPIGYLY